MRDVPRRSLLQLGMLLTAAAILALSFVPGWLVNDRVLLGEGPRELLAHFTAWQVQAVPVISAGVVLEVAVGILAALQLARVLSARWVGYLVTAAAAGGLGLILAGTWPVSQSGHASSVAISPGLPLAAAILLAAVAFACSLRLVIPARKLLIGAAFLVVVAAVGGAAGRAVGLDLAEGTGEHWSEGTYTRAATGDQATELLTLRSGHYSVADRWSGSFTASGTVVILTADPACPTARGTYHVQAAGTHGDIHWEKIVDLCVARAADLQTGIWTRNP